MQFYEDFASLYDKLVSFQHRKRREMPFWKNLIVEHQIHTILDCACGTGQHLQIFRQLGLHVTGSDISPIMLERAKQRLGKSRAEIPLVQCDFRELDKHFSALFDAIVNLGNSLPHLPSKLDITNALGGTYTLLNAPGTFILSLRNYDKLRINRPRFFPVSIRFNHAFVYALDYLPDKIIFNVLHLQQVPKRFAVHSTEYYDLPNATILELLKDAGFHDIICYQDFDGRPFDRQTSDNLLIIARK